MTIREILTQADTLRPNAYTDGEKIHWLNTLEGRIYTEIYRRAEDFTGEYLPFKEGEEERELSVEAPYTDLYLFYLMAMIDFFNGDVARYNDTMVLYNQAWEDYAAYYRRQHKPKGESLTGMLPQRR